MNIASKYILFAGLFVGSASIVYYLSLLLNAPVVIAAAGVAVTAFFLWRWIMGRDEPVTDARTSRWAPVVLVTGFSILVFQAQMFARKYGEIDAWVIWNFHAGYLADAAHWRKLLQNVDNTHIDYPLCLPAFEAFIMRLSGGRLIVPFIVSIMITVLVPLLIYSRLYRKSLVVTAIAFLVLVCNPAYVAMGVSQYADTLVAFFLLCAFACIDAAADFRKYAVLCAAFLGCLIWTKNEGAILAVLFMAFYAGRLLGRGNWKYTLPAVIIPLAVTLLHKSMVDMQDDMIGLQNGSIWDKLLDAGRYRVTTSYFLSSLVNIFPAVTLMFITYLGICIARKRLPVRRLLLLLACFAAYMGIYVLTPYEITWHLATSQARLMHQLMPSLIYVMAADVCDMPFQWLRKEQSAPQ